MDILVCWPAVLFGYAGLLSFVAQIPPFFPPVTCMNRQALVQNDWLGSGYMSAFEERESASELECSSRVSILERHLP